MSTVTSAEKRSDLCKPFVKAILAMLIFSLLMANSWASGDHEPDSHDDSHGKSNVNANVKHEKDSHEKENAHGDDDHGKSAHEKNAHEKSSHVENNHEANSDDADHQESGHQKNSHQETGHKEVSTHKSNSHESNSHESNSHEKLDHGVGDNKDISLAPTSHANPEADKNSHSNVHWSYAGDEGPMHWGTIAEEFSLCGKGRQQSPINITHEEEMNLYPLEFHYGKSSNSQVVNNGHTIQVNYEKGSYAVIGRKKYNLLQFHFHSPSEHQVHGKHADMVAHLVHKSDDGHLAVVAVLFVKGGNNHFLNPIWKVMPKQKGKATVHETLNIVDLIPHDKRYFNYAGSLTTPPCSEGVNWNLFTTYMSVSDSQVSDFMQIFPKSIRPIQAVNERLIGVK